MRKLKTAALAALLPIAALVPAIGTAAPAQAATTHTTPFVCITHSSNIRSCVSVSWERQADNSGIVLKANQAITPDNCRRLEGDGAYGSVRAVLGHFLKSAEWGREGCSWSKSMSWVGNEYGTTTVDVHAVARVNFAGDQNLWWKFELNPNGSWTLLAKDARPVN